MTNLIKGREWFESHTIRRAVSHGTSRQLHTRYTGAILRQLRSERGVGRPKKNPQKTAGDSTQC